MLSTLLYGALKYSSNRERENRLAAKTAKETALEMAKLEQLGAEEYLKQSVDMVISRPSSKIACTADNGEETIYKNINDFCSTFGMKQENAIRIVSKYLPFYRNNIKYTAKYID